MELSDDIIQCAHLVKQSDYERYRVIMTLDPKLRSDLFVLMAANIEISRALEISIFAAIKTNRSDLNFGSRVIMTL